ncbi:C39 family peptidase [Lederbergia graminis]|uniref:C39 family peptidase n=1 Tax=Lederbergia graminis TaxID=735518 RepID=A0ABW0LM10_9BACI
MKKRILIMLACLLVVTTSFVPTIQANGNAVGASKFIDKGTDDKFQSEVSNDEDPNDEVPPSYDQPELPIEDTVNKIHYFDEQGGLTYTEVFSSNNLIKIMEYLPGTTIENVDNSVKFIYNINSQGYIEDATELNSNQEVIKKYEYYPSTTYGTHEQYIQYVFNIEDEYITGAMKLEAQSQRVLSRYEYYPNTKYGAHGNHIKFTFIPSPSGHVVNAYKKENETKRIITRYEYYPNTEYGSHGSNIKFTFNISPDGYVESAYKKENKTRKIVTRYEYYPNTVYGTHGNHIKFTFNINSSGNVINAHKKENETKKIVSRYEYYPGTIYGSHGKYIKFMFNLNSDSYINNAYKRETKTQRLLASYTYVLNTKYGQHGSKITGITLNVPIISQLPELPTGCEITAVTMMLQYLGLDVDKITLANEKPKHPWNPNLGYVGDPYKKNGWTIYPTALMGLVQKYAGSATNLTNVSNSNLERQLLSNKPVVIWGSPIHGFKVHALVLTGFDNAYYYYNDCWTGEKNVRITKQEFNKLWSSQDRRALTN